MSRVRLFFNVLLMIIPALWRTTKGVSIVHYHFVGSRVKWQHDVAFLYLHRAQINYEREIKRLTLRLKHSYLAKKQKRGRNGRFKKK